MKKRLFAMLLAVSMVMGMVVVPAAAETTQQSYEVCPHCNTAWDLCNWQELIVENPSETIPSGHYYLAEDLNTVERYQLGTSNGQTADLAVDVCLDLRGHTLEQTTANSRAFVLYDYSTFAILDSEGGGQVIGTYLAGGGVVYQYPNTRFDLYGGTLINTQTKRTGDGGVVYIGVDAQFNMYGGILDGSQVEVVVNASKSQYPRAAAIRVSGEANIQDGIILGGSTYQGGAIYVTTDGQLNVSGGTIVGGTTQSHGGTIYSQGGVDISGGLITGGIAGSRGGNIYSSSSGDTANLVIRGGVVENGQASSNGGNVSIYGGAATISGGIVRGNVYTAIGITLTGSAVIDNNGYEGIQVAKNVPLVIKDLTEDAKIILRADGNATAADTSPDAAQYLEKGYIVPASRYGLTVTDGVLVGSQDDNGYCPHCGQEVTWEVYTVETATSGHYYIAAGGVEPTADNAAVNIASDVDIVLNLAHGSVKGTVPYNVAGTLSILSTATSIGSFYNNADATTDGGTMYVTGTVNIYDAIVRGTTTTGSLGGGAIFLEGGTLNMYGGRVEGGSAAAGGCIYANTKEAKVNLYNGIITDGETTGNGGNIYSVRATVTMDGGIIGNGASKSGGNVNLGSSGKFYMNGGMLLKGTATDRGGSVYSASTSSRVTITDGVMLQGTATGAGGNLYMNNGILKIYGGSLLNGKSDASSGNLYAHMGRYYINNSGSLTSNYGIIGDNDATDEIPAPVISGGKAPTGGNVYCDGILTLGDCTITGGSGTNGPDFYLVSGSLLTVDPAFTGTLMMDVDATRISELESNRVLTGTTCTQLNGTLYVENYDMALLLKTEDNRLGLGGASLVDIATGSQTWYVTAQEAVNNYQDGKYVRLYATTNTLEMSGDIILDMNGVQATVTGSGKLYGFDSANDDYQVFGTATVSGVTVESMFIAPNNNRYITITNGSEASFHRLGMAITNVSLRPSIAGIYFKATWRCDDTLKALIDTFGVAVSTKNMPGVDFVTDTDTMFTEFAGTTLVSGVAQTSVMLKNVIKSGADNNYRGNADIYAAPYVVLTDGTVLVSDDNQREAGGVVYDMAGVMAQVDRIWPKLSDSQQASIKTLYNLDPEELSGWKLYNITAAINGTPSVRPLKILTLGHSLALDSAHMLNLVADAEGYEGLTIATLYYSGCPLYKHVKFMTEDAAEYSLHLSSTDTPDQAPTKISGVTMKYALEYDDWDIVIMQGGVFEIAKHNTYTNGDIQLIQNYVNKYNPGAIFAWNVTWVPPTTESLQNQYPKSPNTYISGYAAYDNDRSVMYGYVMECVQAYIETDSTFIYVIPAGTAIENALSSHLEETDIYRDYVHMNDLGRVIAAYTWYCTLAGIDHLDEIQLDAIPVAFFKTTTGEEDRVLTDEEKRIILEAVNNALADPYNMTQSQYTVAPTE